MKHKKCTKAGILRKDLEYFPVPCVGKCTAIIETSIHIVMTADRNQGFSAHIARSEQKPKAISRDM
jgi:hypothetical protein